MNGPDDEPVLYHGRWYADEADLRDALDEYSRPEYHDDFDDEVGEDPLEDLRRFLD